MTADPVGADVATKVREWLDRQGYPLEMRVARAFQLADYEVEQSIYYTSNEGKPREIDVCAYFATYWPGQGSKGVVFDFRVVVECKSTPKGKQKPWVVFTSSSRYVRHHGVFTDRLTSTIARNAFELIARDPNCRDLDVFELPDRVGYGISAASINTRSDEQSDGDERRDVAFAAITQLAAGARSQVLSELPESFQRCCVVLPVLVISEPLFECRLDERGDVILEDADEVTLVWRRPVTPDDQDPQMLIHVLQERAISGFVDRVKVAYDYLAQHHKEDIETAAVHQERYKGSR